MGIIESLETSKTKLKEFKKKYKNKKANADRAKLVAERTEYLTCQGKLEESLRTFDTVISSQAVNIREGKSLGMDTSMQEEELRSAAIGYLMVRDAKYQVKSLYSINSIENAYDMLDSVTRYVQGGRLRIPLVDGIYKKRSIRLPERDEALEAKSEIVNAFFDELKQTGDIEACLEKSKTSGNSESFSKQNDDLHERLRSLTNRNTASDGELVEPDSSGDVSVPIVGNSAVSSGSTGAKEDV